MKGLPDYHGAVLGPGALPAAYERRSTISNDNGIQDGTTPPSSYTETLYKSKFFPRGCRGMIEELQIYCKRTGSGTLTLRYSPHPSIGLIGEVEVTPLAEWAWRAAAIEGMWDYDSLFIWVSECDADVSYAYDEEPAYDGHGSADFEETWSDLDIRLFARAVYTGQTLGDVPVSGIINNIPLPSASSLVATVGAPVPKDVLTTVITVEGAGYVDYIRAVVGATTYAEETEIQVFCDGGLAMKINYAGLNTWNFVGSTQNGLCVVLIHKRFEFRRLFEVKVINEDHAIYFSCDVHPTLMR
ncbi:hypothetical protein ES703_124194 [subsurface metagenome]